VAAAIGGRTVTVAYEQDRILITGGAGFVGCSLAVAMRAARPRATVIAFDNLRRRGAELNLPRLAEAGCIFEHGDIRQAADLASVGAVDLLIDASAEPSALAGYDGSPRYLLDTNLVGTINALELARLHRAAFLLISTSRVYPYPALNDLPFRETETRFELDHPTGEGISADGVAETFPLDGPRTLYGATKLASELLVREYADAYGMDAIIDRCGVLAGPGQFGKVDQGVLVLWVARHVFGGRLRYIGWNGTGKQVRDLLHVSDLHTLVEKQLVAMPGRRGDVFNVGGGRDVSVSLLELTSICRAATGHSIDAAADPSNRRGDVRVYLTDASSAREAFHWSPQWSVEAIVDDVARWIRRDHALLKPILGS